MRIILPLAGGTADCAHPPQPGPDAASGASICAYLAWQGLSNRAAFFTDPAVRAAFLAHVHALLTHVNALTGVAYRDDPTILAWENCAACGEGADPAAVAAWTEVLGQAIKATDRFHLYENGAFAGHILPQSPHPVAAADFAPPSVDIVGDRGLPGGDEAGVRATLAAASAAVTRAGRVYVLDGFDWGPRFAATEADLETFLNGVFRERAIAGALVEGLQAHADTGGYLPAPPASQRGGTALYFPGRSTADIAQDDMVVRARALRRFEYDMADILAAPAYLLPPRPEIIAVKHGQVSWRGAAGALDYTIERSPNPGAPNTWEVVCDACATDQNPSWQDPSPPAGPAWYRIMPFNINGHRAVPSAPVAGQ
jgi:mannan endo-1,4-beta-mannosidase